MAYDTSVNAHADVNARQPGDGISITLINTHQSTTTNNNPSTQAEYVLQLARKKNEMSATVNAARVPLHGCISSNLELALLPTARLRLITDAGVSGTLRALCDTGSQVNLITKRCVRRLGLPVHRTSIAITGVTRQVSMHATGMVLAELFHHHADQSTDSTAQFLVVPSLTHELPTVALPPDTPRGLNTDMSLADPGFRVRGPIDAILGAGVMSAIDNGEAVPFDGQFTAHGTSLGYIISGPAACFWQSTAMCAVATGMNDFNMADSLRRLWEIEELPAHFSLLTVDEKWTEDQFSKTITRDIEGRYIVTIPIRPGDEEKLGRSHAVAVKRFHAL